MDVDELDIEDRTATERYLVAAGHCSSGELTQHEVLAGGVSGRTVRVSFADGRQWVLKQALAKLRVQADWFSDPRRIHREAQGMQALAELAPPGAITKLLFDDERHHVIGMEAVPQPHENWKSILLAGRVSSDHVRQFADLLAAMHAESRHDAVRFSAAFADDSYYRSLRLEPYYEYGAAQEPRAAPFLRRLVGATLQRKSALVHGDYSPKNVLVFGGRLVLLDHEVIHWGDPAFDVGFALTHLLSKSHHVVAARSRLTDESLDWWNRYRNAMASRQAEVDETACVEHVLGCLLARVVGRSPLEYLSSDERTRQLEAVIRLVHGVPASISELIARFRQEIES